MKKLFYLSISLIFFTSCDNYPTIVMINDIQKGIEYGYFEGQKDALNNDIRIEMLKDSTYIWKYSPWNSKEEPLFNPRISLDSNFK